MIDGGSTLWMLMGLVLLLMPGLSWSFLLLNDDDAQWPRRLLTSIGLSLVIMPLAAFWLNLAAGVPLTTASLVLISIAMSLPPVAYLVWKRWAQP